MEWCTCQCESLGRARRSALVSLVRPAGRPGTSRIWGSAQAQANESSIIGTASDLAPDLLSWLNLRGRNFSDCALQNATQKSLLSLPSSNNVRINLVFLFIPTLITLRNTQDRRVAQQTKLLKERNASLLRAVATVKQNPSSSTVFVPGTNEESVPIARISDSCSA